MSRKPSTRVQSGVVRNPTIFHSNLNSRPISAREKYELGNRRKDHELRKFNQLKETVDEFKKNEFQAIVYNGLSQKGNRFAEAELKEKEKRDNLLKRKQQLRELLQKDEEIYKAAKMERQRPPETRRPSQLAIYPEVESLRLQLANLKKKNAEDREKMAQQLSSNTFGRNHQTSRIFF